MESDDIAERFEHGIKLFNEKKFYECHDVLEDVWFDIRDETRKFYQGLIHLAVGFHHILERQNPKGAESQLRKGLDKLNYYKPEFQGVELMDLLKKIEICLLEIQGKDKKDVLILEDTYIPEIKFNKKNFKL
jgi:predicted metal-dependent hydrolase